MTTARRICRDCGGPLDILHTATECRAIQRAIDVPDDDRYHLSVIASLIDCSPSSMAAAYKLYTDGFLKRPKAAT